MIFIYLITLFIAPQLWIEPFIGLHTDYYIYPLWILVVILTKDRNPFVLNIADIFFLLMLLWIVLSMVANGGFHEKSNDVIINYSKWFVLFKLISITVATPKCFKAVALFLVFFALVLSIEGIEHRISVLGLGWAGQSLGWIDPSAKDAGIAGRTRWINIFDGPGVFCVIYTTALPFLLQYLVAPFRGSVRLLGLSLLGLLLVAIYFTGSRGGFLATLALFALFAAIHFKISPIRIMVFGSILGLVFMLAPNYITTMDDQSKSARHRIDMWIEGVEMIQQNPVFGIGKGRFVHYTNRLLAHNSAIEIMGETGFPGLFFWIGLIYFSLKSVIYYMREAESDSIRSYALALGLSVVGYIISSMFVTLEYETFYLLLGLCTALGLQLKKPVPFARQDFKRISIITVGWVVVIKAFLMAY